jgi:hypothetical protein
MAVNRSDACPTRSRAPAATVMFVDMVGSTGRHGSIRRICANRHGPSEACAEMIVRFEGHVARSGEVCWHSSAGQKRTRRCRACGPRRPRDGREISGLRSRNRGAAYGRIGSDRQVGLVIH